ncbi:MAG: transglycosylase domain-containing protein, partial [Patescibacteria group bacterium]
MARHKDPNLRLYLNLYKIFQLLWFPILILIRIGDGVRFLLSRGFLLLFTTYNITKNLLGEIYEATASWLREKKLSLKPRRKGIIFPAPRLPISTQLKAFVAGGIATILFLFLPYNTYLWLKALPNPQLLENRDIEVTTRIFDRNGILLYEIYAEQNRTPLALTDIPEIVKKATIAMEDRDFYRHQGVSLRGILRAAREIFFHRRIQGGSTITQQLIKSALLTPEVKIPRKVKEIILAFWAERLYSKDKILEMYLNQVPYGGTAWGIEAASQMYFGKSVKDVTLAEAALLAGLPAAPTEYSPFGSHPEKAFARQAEVVRRMVEDGYIKSDEAQKALESEIRFITPRTTIRAPHFVMYIKELLEERYGPRLVERGGLRIKTSLDITLQEKVEDIVRSQLENLAGLRVGNGAALVTRPTT